MVACVNPFSGIILDIVPDLCIILLISDYMVIKRPLPDFFANFPVRKSFQCPYKTGNGGIAMRFYCRGWPPGQPALLCQGEKQMNVIGHDDITVNRNIVIIAVHFLYPFFHCFPAVQ